MGAIWSLMGSDVLRHPATSVILVVGLFLGGCLVLRAVGLVLAFRLSRRAIEQGYPVEAASGREFYFKIPSREKGGNRTPTIQKPRPTRSGSRARALRVARGYTLANLSTASNIPASRLSALETGRVRFLDGDIAAIAQSLNLTRDDTANLKVLAKLDAEAFEEK